MKQTMQIVEKRKGRVNETNQQIRECQKQIAIQLQEIRQQRLKLFQTRLQKGDLELKLIQETRESLNQDGLQKVIESKTKKAIQQNEQPVEQPVKQQVEQLNVEPVVQQNVQPVVQEVEEDMEITEEEDEQEKLEKYIQSLSSDPVCQKYLRGKIMGRK